MGGRAGGEVPAGGEAAAVDAQAPRGGRGDRRDVDGEQQRGDGGAHLHRQPDEQQQAERDLHERDGVGDRVHEPLGQDAEGPDRPHHPLRVADLDQAGGEPEPRQPEA